MSRGVRILLTLLVLYVLTGLIASCSSDPKPPDPGLNSTKVERRSAMLSIYYHSYPEIYALNHPKAYVPIAVTTAADILAGDSGPAAEHRIRQAIVSLSVGRIEEGGFDEKDIVSAINTLAAPIDIIEPIEETFEEGDFRSDAEASQAIYALLSVLGLGENCAPSTTDVGYDATTQGTIAVFAVRGVERDFDELAELFDPQNWAHCSDYFSDSFIAREVSGSYPRDSSGTAEPATSTPDPGTTWRKVLFEFFDMSTAGFDVWFKNLLNIDAHRTNDLFFFQYSLHESIKTRIGLITYNQGLARDQGYATVRRMPDDTVNIDGLKLFQYDWQLWYLNPQVQLFLGALGSESAVIACTCELPEEESTFWGRFWEWVFGGWL
jgi:hypothetical protein